MMTEENMKVAAGRGSLQVDFGPLRHRQAPEEQLMIAVLQDALDCLVKYRFATTHFERRLFEDARRWILADRAVGPFSFAFICATLGLETNAVRRCLRANATAQRTSRAAEPSDRTRMAV
jgi:hypothetical protein